MVSVTWGTNVIHNINGNQPSSPPATGGGGASLTYASTPGTNLFGTPSTPAPAPVTSPFGAAPTPAIFGTPGGGLFGTPAPAPSGTSLFGTPAPAAPGSSFFGTPAPAPSTSGFFTSPAPAPTTGGGLFGGGAFAPAPASGTSGGFFGAGQAAGGLFGQPSPWQQQSQQQPQQQQQQVPAQAALQAHIDASARQEADRVRSALEKIHGAYTGMPGHEIQKTQKFVSIHYTDITPEHRQLLWLHSLGTGGISEGLSQLVAPPKPPHVSEEDWYRAVVNNPDPANLMPMALVGAEALQARLSWQQNRATEMARHAEMLQKTLDTVQQHSEGAQNEIQRMMHNYEGLKLVMLDKMRKVELARCMNQPLQPDEAKVMERLFAMCQKVNKMRKILNELDETIRAMPPPQVTSTSYQQPSSSAPAFDKERLLPFLKEHRKQLEAMTEAVNRDVRDIHLLQQHVVPKL